MPIKYIGKQSKFVGKTAFEILGNLKNFGVGRVIVRSSFFRYPEPTFYRVIKVQPQMDPENKFGIVWADTVFRGMKFNIRNVPSPYVKDFRLLSKEEEEDYCKILHEKIPTKLLPAFGPFPPLFKELIIQEKKMQGNPVTEDPKLPLVYNKNNLSRYRKVEDGETPDIEFTLHAESSLYEDVFTDEMKDKLEKKTLT